MVIFRIVKGLSLPDVRGDQAETMLRQNLWRERRHQDQMQGILGRRRGGVRREGQTRGHSRERVSSGAWGLRWATSPLGYPEQASPSLCLKGLGFHIWGLICLFSDSEIYTLRSTLALPPGWREPLCGFWLPWGGGVPEGTHCGCSGRGGQCGPSAPARDGQSMPPSLVVALGSRDPAWTPWRAGATWSLGSAPAVWSLGSEVRGACGLRAWSAPRRPL